MKTVLDQSECLKRLSGIKYSDCHVEQKIACHISVSTSCISGCMAWVSYKPAVYKVIAWGSSPHTMYSVHHFHICGVLPNWPEYMIRMIVVATDSVDNMPSKQFTTVPFRPLLTGLTTILDISGKLFEPESLEKVIMEVLIVRDGGVPVLPTEVTRDVWQGC